MSYIALYRKYRPSTFGSIYGQQSVTKILKNQIKSSRISHAYIFSGSRGTGKTSAAKIFARAINCLNPKDGEPCNECSVCKNILEGNTTDVIEMDAASNNSVENIRQIRQEVVYATIDVKYRVYIIDEAHMLTTSAFNALLKTLEEPPENVVFILATTEQHKIPVTILSRCLRFEFNKISENDIIDRLKYVLNEENIKYEESAVNYIAKLADGGMRDSLSILERCISELEDVLKYSDVAKIVGAIDNELIEKTVQDVLNLDSISVIKNIDEISNRGKDLRQFNSQIIENLLEKLINSKDDNKNKYIAIIDKLSKLDNELRLTSRPVILLKATFVEICNLSFNNINKDGNSNSTDIDIKALKQKISSLELELSELRNKIDSGVVSTKKVSNITNTVKPTEKVDIKNTNSTNEVKNVESVDNSLVRFSNEDEFKKIIITQGKIKLYSSIAAATLYVQDGNLIVITDNSFAYTVLNTAENMDDLRNIFEQNYGSVSNVTIRLSSQKQENSIKKIQKDLEKSNTDYVSID